MPDAAPVPEPLSAADFPAFYRHVHGVDPFPWQADLTARVLADGRWPDLVDVPTGLGKTSTIDIAVFVAAATSGTPGSEGPGRRRCFLVVDRRLVVDEAFTHAQHLASTVGAAEGGDGVAGRVATGLRAYAPTASGELLPVTRMRGGTTWDDAWLDRPDRPGIVLGTVDQIGSRLLFRGYGVSDRRRPLDAALVGTDSIVLVDEAHLATALITTTGAAHARDNSGLPVPGTSIVRLSATATAGERSYRFDENAHRDHAEAWRRVTAGKQCTTRTATVKTCPRVLADTVVEQLDALTGAETPWTPVGLVVCNTVDRAREVHALLRKGRPDLDPALLIGRARPADRADVQRRVVERCGVARQESATPTVLVATQTVEVGVNLDVDVLVSESASWDALVQRLGRLNRLGRFSTRFPSRRQAPAVVVHDGQAGGPVYGAARDHTWAALGGLDGSAASDPDTGVDVSPLRCRHLSATDMVDPRFSHRPTEVPVLLTPILDAWVQTGPVPLNDPPVAPYLHGFESGAASVQILWRDGLLAASQEPGDVVDPFDDEGDDAERAPSQVEMLLAQWPPRAGEIVEVPFVAARRWLAGEGMVPVADVDGAPEQEPPARRTAGPIRALAQRVADRGADDSVPRWTWIDAAALRPGDRVAVPAERGGHDDYGWAPADTTPVADVREALSFAPSRSRREAALTLDAGLSHRLGIEPDDPVHGAVARLADLGHDIVVDDPDRPDLHDVGSALSASLPVAPPAGRGWTDEAWQTLRDWLRSEELESFDMTDPTDAWVAGAGPRPWRRLLAGPRPDGAAVSTGAVAEGDDDDVAASSVGSGRITLAVHHEAVGARAGEIASALGLSDQLRSVCVDAARWHDLGKADDRFQVMLHGGDEVDAALASEPLAKSGMNPSDRAAWRRAARLSGLPPGARHEAWSAALVEEHLSHHPYPGDADLLLHLIASHHGHARPWDKLVTDTAPRDIRVAVDGHKTTVSSARTVSLEHPGRFRTLNERYGRWGLALLEAVVRCADTTVSGEGS